MRLIRVFPRKTSHTPIDSMAFVGDPPLMRPEADEVRVSCAFTWDKPKAERLAQAWGQYYSVVKLGGPAYGSPSENFTPGLYVKEGITFTSRGCNNTCPFCLVNKREGSLKLIDDFAPGHTIQDNNILQTGKAHISKVIEMLKHQKAATFSGGLEADLVTGWFAEEIRSIKIANVFLACDSPTAIHPLRKAVKTLKGLTRHQLRCYVLIGYQGESIERATERLEGVWDAGCMPFAQLFQPADRWIDYSTQWRQLRRTWSRPAAMVAAHATK